jgi:hypothetical protein
MSPEMTVNIPIHIDVRDLGTDFVLVDLKQGTYFGLNPVGARMWALMSEGCSLGEVCATVANEYGVEPERVQGDLEALLESLIDAGLIEPINGEA